MIYRTSDWVCKNKQTYQKEYMISLKKIGKKILRHLRLKCLNWRVNMKKKQRRLKKSSLEKLAYANKNEKIINGQINISLSYCFRAKV